MIQDVFIPSKIGSYYFFKKRVLGFEITSSSVQASLLYFYKKNIVVENSMHIPLQDLNPTTIINAIKKIATTIGNYDEVVTCLSSAAVVCKELTLPFIGREKIGMIIRYEVEPLLPFPLDEAVVDFLITQEDFVKKESTILVAASRKTDLATYIDYFEKAGVVVHNVSLDMFALYDFYRHTMYAPQAYTSLLLVDFGLDAIRILYIQKGILKSVRLVPYGIIAMMKKVDHVSQDFAYSSLENLLEEQTKDHDEQVGYKITQQICAEFAKQMMLSISFFQKQMKNFIVPSKIICLGAGTQLQDFVQITMHDSQIPVEILDMKKIAARNNMILNRKVKIEGQYSLAFIIPLSVAHYGDINFLSEQEKKLSSTLLIKQLITLLSISLLIIGGIYFYSNYQLKLWNVDYEKSKKQLVNTIKDQMNVDIKNVKRVSEIVAAANNTLQQTKKVCLSYSQTSNNYLHYLQELCTSIDRESVGLKLHKMILKDQEIILKGKIGSSSVNDDPWTNLNIFTQELIQLKGFTLKNIPAELSFNVTLVVKENQENHNEALTKD